MWSVGACRAFLLVFLLVFAALGLGGCREEAPLFTAPPVGSGKFGDRCLRTEDCESALCVRVDQAGGVCTSVCSSRAECPPSRNWGCVDPRSLNAKICGCVPDAAKEICGDGVDNDCDGRTDDCRMCGFRPVADDDPAHCGRCDNACRSDQLCENGNCRCRVGTVECSGACVDTSASIEHCGMCGNSCGEGRECRGGTCVCSNPARSDYCPAAGCTSLDEDPDNCGACGTECGFAQTCVNGRCDCPESTHTVCGSECIKLDSDTSNCGSCGKACIAGEVCESGSCACKSNLVCGGSCMPPDDPANCGACGKTCSSSQTCRGGQCVCTASYLTACGDSCVALSADVTNCGSCGKACRPTEQCSNGTCACPYGSTWCDSANACVYVTTDTAHCGSCDHACRSGEQCLNGTCACATYGESWCSSTNGCVQTQSDNAHCGGCDIACRTGESCVYGSCTCPASGQAWCPSAGTCVDTRGSVNHCGGCDVKCRTGEVCTNGTCACLNANEKWCSAAGTCVDTSSSNAHCGDCNNACRSGETCQGGYCRCPGFYDQWCASAGTCVDTASDERHCTGCDLACPAQTHCTFSGCACDQAGLSLCGSSCVDLQTNKNNCNSCGNACSGSLQCIGGACRCPDPLLGAEVRLTTNAITDSEPAARWDGTHAGVAFLRGDRPNGYEYRSNVVFTLLNADGTSAHAEVPLTSFDPSGTDGVATAPSIAWTGSEYAIVWSEYTYTTQAASYTLVLQRVSPAGSLIGSKVVLLSETYLEDGANPLITWSSTYGGYAIVTSRNNGYVRFQRRGALGTTNEPPNIVNLYGIASSFFALPAGGWGIGMSHSNCTLIRINADGSRTLPITTIAQTSQFACDTVWDGTTFATSWGTLNYAGSGDLWINRGEQTNNPYKAGSVNIPAIVYPLDATALVVGPGSTLNLAYEQAASSSGFALKLARFAVPAGTGSALTPITGAVNVLASDTIPSGDNFRIISTGNNLLALWVDNRWGAREIYARPIDLRGCP
jgi:hypothetical protein